MSFWGRVRRRKTFKAALWVLGLGCAPLLLYGLFGPADGNPIGLGLLFVAVFHVGLILLATAVFSEVLKDREEE